MRHARRFTTRLILSGISVAGLCIVGAALTTGPTGGAASPITLTETWNSGRLRASTSTTRPAASLRPRPSQFDDGGTPGVEVGDRKVHLRPRPAERLSVAGMGQRHRQRHRTGTGLRQTTGRHAGDRRHRRRGARQPARRLDGIGRPDTATSTSAPATRPPRSTAATTRTAERQRGVEPGRDQPVERHGPQRGRPGVAAHRGRRLAGRSRFARSGDLRARTARTALPHRAGRSSRPTACSRPPPSVTSTARGRTTSSRVARPRTVSPTATTTATAATSAIYNDTVASSAAPTRTRRWTRRPPSVPSCRAGTTASRRARAASSAASDENTVKVFDTKCNQVWSDNARRHDRGSPALADVEGNGQLAVVEGTVTRITHRIGLGAQRRDGPAIWQPTVLGARSTGR